MKQYPNPPDKYTVEEMLHAFHNPQNNLRSLAELDTVINEIVDRNPEWVAELTKIIEKKRSQ